LLFEAQLIYKINQVDKLSLPHFLESSQKLVEVLVLSSRLKNSFWQTKAKELIQVCLPELNLFSQTETFIKLIYFRREYLFIDK